MTPDDIARLLADEEEVVPSSGFEASVMEAVLQEATAPLPLAFPWLRALPGFVALLVAVGVAIWNGITAFTDFSGSVVLDEHLRALLALVTRAETQWTAFAVVMTVVSALLPLRLMRGRL